MNKGQLLESFLDGLKDYKIRSNKKEVYVIRDMSQNKGFIRGNVGMEIVYVFRKDKLHHISIVEK